MSIFFTEPYQMEPLLIDWGRPVFRTLAGLASDLLSASACLGGQVHKETARDLSQLVSGMNCYYSNLIEGHKTRPLEIAQTLSGQSAANTQNLVVAHLAASRWATHETITPDTLPAFLLGVHQMFCERLPDEMRTLADGSLMSPGQFRRGNVSVGLHVAPEAARLDGFIKRFSEVYGRSIANATKSTDHKLESVIGAFAAHHRFAWIHPFPDGNGRVGRILLDSMLRQSGVDGIGLWSMSRGFAKSTNEYKLRLANADQLRMGDLDGRGNLSEKCLAEFIAYGIAEGIDQARFMSSKFDLENIKTRINGYFGRVRLDLSPTSAALYLQALVMGSFERMEAGRITGLPERTARNVLAALIKEGLLVSDSPKGKVRAGFPVHALGSLFPNLYPSGDLDLTQPLT